MEYEIKKFKDGQVTAKIKGDCDLHVKLRGNSYQDLFEIASIKKAWDFENSTNKNLVSTLTIYCLIAQRSDRRFSKLESFDLKVVSNFINAMCFDKVEISNPHSSVSLTLIDNSEEIKSFDFVKKAYEAIGNPILVSPDAGAYKTTHEFAGKLNADLISSNKVRVNGAPLITIQGDVKGKECLIVDDFSRRR